MIQFREHQRVERIVNGGCDLGRDDSVTLCVNQQNSSRGEQFLKAFGDAQLFRTLGPTIFCGERGTVVRLGPQPANMRVDGGSYRLILLERFQGLPGAKKCGADSTIDVVALLEVYVLEQIAANASGGNGISVHVDSGEMRNCSFDGHQAAAKIIVDAGFGGESHDDQVDYTERRLSII